MSLCSFAVWGPFLSNFSNFREKFISSQIQVSHTKNFPTRSVLSPASPCVPSSSRGPAAEATGTGLPCALARVLSVLLTVSSQLLVSIGNYVSIRRLPSQGDLGSRSCRPGGCRPARGHGRLDADSREGLAAFLP